MIAAESEDAGRRPAGTLRRGWTTGACAAAAAGAAATALLTGRFPSLATVRLPRGLVARFPLATTRLDGGAATAGIVKDAGDDPDDTHGLEVRATVTQTAPGSGIAFAAGEGVGTVTLPGLPLGVGEPAINPAPRTMIAAALRDAAEGADARPDLLVTVSIPGGYEVARRTMNPRLGIVGGLSVLGTTGIVVPYSCAAWIASIRRGIDVARAQGHAHIAGATGRTSEAAVQTLYGLPETALIDMGDFAGGMIKYLARHPVERLTVAGGFAKLAKLAQGALDLHSARSSVDIVALADLLDAAGAPAASVAAARAAPGAGAVLAAAGDRAPALAGSVARRARDAVQAALPGRIAVDVVVFDRAGALLGRA
ncbi:MAG: cobalt-precorrin-5B (C(1))-methyltransferase [Alphaproteobacteria bacterium]|nr:cobalt-precorrin-5B (C(1))-methyltransferase [Alphaproteobacteria bacterium]